jgi:hypothetical protein
MGYICVLFGIFSIEELCFNFVEVKKNYLTNNEESAEENTE